MADRLADFVADFIGRHRDRPFFVYYPMDIVHRPLVATPDRPGAAGGGVEGLEVRAFDATTVREPGRTGSLWRVHYSLCLSSLRCDFFAVTPARGVGNGEHFTRFPVGAGEYILADRGYATVSGLRHASAAGGWVTVRVTRARWPCIARTGRRSTCLRRCPDCGTPGRSAVAGRGRRPARRAGPCLHGPQVGRGRPAGAQEGAPRGPAPGQQGQARDARLCELCHRLHHLPRRGVRRSRGARMLPPALAGRACLQAPQIAGPARPPAQARPRERPRLALRQAPPRPAGRQGHPPRPHHFPLGIRPGAAAEPLAPGARAASSSTNSEETSNRPSPSPASSTPGTPSHAPATTPQDDKRLNSTTGSGHNWLALTGPDPGAGHDGGGAGPKRGRAIPGSRSSPARRAKSAGRRARRGRSGGGP